MTQKSRRFHRLVRLGDLGCSVFSGYKIWIGSLQKYVTFVLTAHLFSLSLKTNTTKLTPFGLTKSHFSTCRGFLQRTAMASITALLGTEIVFADRMPANYLPVVFGNEPDPMLTKHKDLLVLNNKPWNVEAQPHLLDDAITPR